jgi:hypothetical protein
MNTEGDYLWDKTGEPDPEIQQLEEVLGALRYQPRQLEIPAGITVGKERTFFRRSAPGLAIAATIAIVLLGLGLWLGLQRMQRNEPSQIVRSAQTPAVKPEVVADPNNDRSTSLPPATADKGSIGSSGDSVKHPLLARNAWRGHGATRKSGNNETLSAKKLQEAETAKDQLMLALRVASAKLSFVQRKTQGLNQRDQIHNQHKIG